MPPILIAQNISKRFGATPLFDNISCAVHDGDRISLIGPNGAGKSTLLAILGAEQQSDSGDVSFRKSVPIGYVHQISDFASEITVRQVIEAALERAAVPAATGEQLLRETLGRAGFMESNTRGSRTSGNPGTLIVPLAPHLLNVGRAWPETIPGSGRILRPGAGSCLPQLNLCGFKTLKRG